MKTTFLLVGRVAASIALLVAWSVGGQARADASIPNVQITDDGDLFHVEPSVAANPANPQNLLAATQLFQAPDPTTLGAYASFDGGQSWQDVGPLPLPAGANTGDDVTVAFDADGHGFIAAMVTSEEGGQMSRTDRNIAIWRTDDGGQTFAAPVAAVSHQFVDHPWLAVDPVSGALYLAWVADEHAGAGFTRSTDGGATFDPPRTVATPAGSVSSPVIAAANGTVEIAYETGVNGADPFAEEDEESDSAAIASAQGPAGEVDAQIEVVGSLDGGTTFGEPMAIAQVASEPALAEDVHLPTGPSLAIEPDGAIDLAYVALDPDTAELHVLLARAAGAGQSFDPPVTVDATWPGDLPAFFQPQVVVGESGAIAISAFALAGDRVDVVLWQAASGGAPFGPATRVTGEPFDPAHGVPETKHGAWWIGDYQGLATAGGVLYPLWNDARTGNLELFATAVPFDAGNAVPATPEAPTGTPAAVAIEAVQVTTDPAYPDHAEPSIAVDPRDPLHLFGASQFFAAAGPLGVVGTFVSFDGGIIWTEHAPLTLPEGIILANDVTVAFDPDGVAFVSAGLSTDTGEGGFAVWRSDDGGRSFGQPVRVVDEGADHPWLAIDRGPGPDAGTLYVAWAGPQHETIFFSRSTDSGQTFDTPRPISAPDDPRPELSVVTAGPSGTVYVVYGAGDDTTGPLIRIVASNDGGRTFKTPQTLPRTVTPQNIDVDRALNSGLAAAADPNGATLYVASADVLATTGHRAVLVWRTSDGGQTWDEPVTISSGESLDASAYQPQLAVGPTGIVAVSAYVVIDNRISVVVSQSPDGGASFEPPSTVASPFDPTADLKPESQNHFIKQQTDGLPWIGDFQGLAIGPTAIYPCWTDTGTGQLAIFFAAVPLA